MSSASIVQVVLLCAGSAWQALWSQLRALGRARPAQMMRPDLRCTSCLTRLSARMRSMSTCRLVYAAATQGAVSAPRYH